MTDSKATTMTDTELILQEIAHLRTEMREEMRDMRSDLTDFRTDVGERLSSVETSVHSLEGNGQPGRVGILETSLSAPKTKVSYMWGYAVGAGAVVGLFAGGVLVEVLKRGHSGR
jgi:hypothetical protein